MKDRFINASLILLVELGKTFGAAAIIIIQERSIFRWRSLEQSNQSAVKP